MNWDFVKWVAGVLLTLAAIKFVWTVFRTLFSKETMENVIDTVADKIHSAGEKMTEVIKDAAASHAAKKEMKNKVLELYLNYIEFGNNSF